MIEEVMDDDDVVPRHNHNRNDRHHNYLVDLLLLLKIYGVHHYDRILCVHHDGIDHSTWVLISYADAAAAADDDDDGDVVDVLA